MSIERETVEGGWLKPNLGIRGRHALSWVGGIGAGAVGVCVLLAIVGPWLAPHDPTQTLSNESFGFPPEAAFLGTDYLGRDLLSRLLHGGRLTLFLSLATAFLAFALGVTAGFAAAIAGRWIDLLLSRAADGLLAIPSIILALMVIGSLGTSLSVLIGTVAVIEGGRIFRVARALARDLSVMDFMEAARARGEGMLWLMLREMGPNAVGPLITEFGLRYTYTLLFISALSFLGFGTQPPGADWGAMVKENIEGLLYGSPAALLPAALIAVATIGVNLVIDAYLDRATADRVPDMLP
jgi:peptide/nickel transport system permease protein